MPHPPRVLVLFNEPVLPADHPDSGAETDVLYSVKIVRESLTAEGIPNDEFGIASDVAKLVARLERRDFDVVFNLYEGTADRSITEVYCTGLLEWLRIPYTGCPSGTLALARNKVMAKRLFRGSGIPTPEFAVVREEPPEANPLGAWPIIVKPASEDASIGIDQGSVVENDADLKARAKYVIEKYGGAALVERFIPGREIQVSLVDVEGNGDLQILPFAEIAFKPPAGGKSFWPVYTYTAKWDEKSDEYEAAPVVVGVELAPEVTAAIHEVCLAAFRALEARDFARVDLRVTAEGNVYVLELNPNPSITSMMLDSGLPAIGVSYNRFIAALAENAAKRGG
jgi:D-alanine-D-alanine ligase